MPPLRLNQTVQETFRVRFQRGRRRFGTVLQRHAQFVRVVRHRQTPFPLTRNASIGKRIFSREVREENETGDEFIHSELATLRAS
jgi:hypothetical protein